MSAERETVGGAAGSVVLRASGLTKRYGDRTALDAVDVEARQGERVAIIGPNGAGKTTLLAMLAGVVRPSGGEVAVDGRIGWVPQQTALYSKLSPRENLRLFARLERIADGDREVERMLGQIGLADRADEEVGRLSGGNRQRVNVAIGLLSRPPVLLLDEPTSSLDPRQRAVLWEFVGELAEQGTTVIFTTHHVGEAHRYSDRLLVLAGGRIVFSGSEAQLREAAGAGDDFESAFVALLERTGG